MDEVAARRLSPRLLLGFFVLSCLAAVVLMPSLVQGNEYHGMGSFIRNLIGVWGLTLVGLPVLDVRLAWIPSVTHTLAWLAFGTARPWWTFTARPATDPLSWALSLGILALGLALAPALMGHPRLLRVTRTHLDLL